MKITYVLLLGAVLVNLPYLQHTIYITLINFKI